MQIKKRGHNVQLLRSEYQPDKKRTIQKSLGTFDASACIVITEVPESILNALDKRECEELAAWFENRAEQRKALRPYLSPAMAKALQNAAIATEIAADVAVDIEIDEDDLRELVRVWQKLTKVIRSKDLQLPLICLPPSVNDPEKMERLISMYVKIDREAKEEKGQWNVKVNKTQKMYEDHESYQLHAEEEKIKLVAELIAMLEQAQSS